MKIGLSKAVQRAPFVLAALLIALAFFQAWQATQGLQWPPTDELLRDTGLAQAIVDGQGGVDPHIPGEVRWSNPAVPTLIAAVSRLSNLPVPATYAQAGPYLNLLGPIGLFILVLMLSEEWTALITLIAYLFLANPQQTALHQATYSAWPWSWTVAQGLFFLTTSAMLQTLRSRHWRWAILSGLLLGLTLLTDTVPMLVLLVFFSVLSGFFSWHTIDPRERRGLLRLYFLTIACASLLSAYFVWPLLLTYGFQIRNSVPAEVLTIGPQLVAENLLGMRSVVFILSLVALWLFPALFGLTWRRVLELRILLSILASLFVLSFLLHVLRGLGLALPQFFPLHSFYLYFRVAETIIFGAGLLMIARTILDMVVSDLPAHIAADPRPVLPVLALVGALVYWNAPGARASLDMDGYRQLALATQSDTATVALYEWITQHTREDAVFFAIGEARTAAVLPSGRKLLVQERIYANPFVAPEQREADGRLLLQTITDGDKVGFDRIADAYQLGYLILPVSDPHCCLPGREPLSGLSVAFRNSNWVVYQR